MRSTHRGGARCARSDQSTASRFYRAPSSCTFSRSTMRDCERSPAPRSSPNSHTRAPLSRGAHQRSVTPYPYAHSAPAATARSPAHIYGQQGLPRNVRPRRCTPGSIDRERRSVLYIGIVRDAGAGARKAPSATAASQVARDPRMTSMHAVTSSPQGVPRGGTIHTQQNHTRPTFDIQHDRPNRQALQITLGSEALSSSIPSVQT